MLTRWLKGLAIGLALALSSAARADVEVRSSVGQGFGSLRSTTTVPVRTTPITLGLNWEKQGGWLNHGMVGAVFQHQLISYRDDGAVYQGTNVLGGATVGFELANLGSQFVRLEGVYYPYNLMTVAADTKSTVNDKSYSHSTLTTFHGTGAWEVRVAYTSEKTDGQFNKRERLRYGVFVSELVQSINKSSIRIASSNPSLEPSAVLRSDVNYSLNMTTIAFLVSFAN